jgi:uncharacterized damage-inducible protein DinB
MAIARPGVDEYAPYYQTYIDQVSGTDVVPVLTGQRDSTARLLASIPESKAGHRYAEGKWSLREVIGHLSDTERIFGYRLLRFARADESPLAGFDENRYVPAGDFERRSLADLAGEFTAVRDATLPLVRSLDASAQLRRGSANGKSISVRALAWIIAGHEAHHVRVIRERYLGG